MVEAANLATAFGKRSAVAEPERQAVEVGGEPEQVDLAAPAWRRAASSSLQKVQARRSGLAARAASRRPMAMAADSRAPTISPAMYRSAMLEHFLMDWRRLLALPLTSRPILAGVGNASGPAAAAFRKIIMS